MSRVSQPHPVKIIILKDRHLRHHRFELHHSTHAQVHHNSSFIPPNIFIFSSSCSCYRRPRIHDIFIITMTRILVYVSAVACLSVRTWGFVRQAIKQPIYSIDSIAPSTQLPLTQARQHDNPLCLLANRDGNRSSNGTSHAPSPSLIQGLRQSTVASAIVLTLSCLALTAPLPSQAATDPGAIVGCLFQKCQLPLLKCISNPKCLANVICINTCNGREDEIGCQIQCGDLFENSVVGDFNKCVVSDMGCVPQKPDDGQYPEPDPSVLVSKFDTKLWNGKWYITAGQNPLFDVRDEE
jgi:hypothetical protein